MLAGGQPSFRPAILGILGPAHPYSLSSPHSSLHKINLMEYLLEGSRGQFTQTWSTVKSRKEGGRKESQILATILIEVS